ncbi:hypothetical protein M433DRAFT_149390 [Acidomyces richmondensis BFW]|nr:MAG: hypothetical protein FE78DRAFT_89401 [Acidomyces sp. 'richmondensis']KYG50038.1 hypothetical protein M433DRAFT_149390 [Acidomyces richmondensis BFW]
MSTVLGLALPKEYGYVLTTTAATFFLAFWHGTRVTMFRKTAGIKYPKAFADSGDLNAADPEKKKAMYLFNCAQRAHGNFLENHPSTAIAMLVAGVKYPLWATGLGVGWIISRIIYAIGYTRADKTAGEGRLAGSAFWLCQLGLFGLMGWMGVQMLL